jgi:hypothetical protein
MPASQGLGALRKMAQATARSRAPERLAASGTTQKRSATMPAVTASATGISGADQTGSFRMAKGMSGSHFNEIESTMLLKLVHR